MARDRSKKGCFKRPANTREERKVVSTIKLITISFKDIDFTQPKGNEQTFETWSKDGLLEPLLERVRQLTKLTRDEAVKQQIIKIYGDIPKHSDFNQPNHLEENISWAVLKGIGGQVSTLAGYIVENTFYAVFLDKEHRFWPSNKKNT
jgi:hypothetical protein